MTSREKIMFFELGLGYYITARFAAFAGFTPVCGNLFHHAIEMFLKGYLCTSYDLKTLKELGHNLGPWEEKGVRKLGLWDRFKQGGADHSLDRFDKIVNDLNKFESIRYPDKIIKYGMQSIISLTHRPTESATCRNDDGSISSGPPTYQIVVKEIDELVKVLFEKASVNPLSFTAIMREDVKRFFLMENETPLIDP